MLVCGCDDESDVYYEQSDCLESLATARARRCCSCGERIAVGDLCLRHRKYRITTPHSVEEAIHGEWRLADRYMCERCAGLWWALEERGYCVPIEFDQRELARQAGAIDLERQRAAVSRREMGEVS